MKLTLLPEPRPDVAWFGDCFGPALPCELEREEQEPVSAAQGSCWRTSYLPVRKAACL